MKIKNLLIHLQDRVDAFSPKVQHVDLITPHCGVVSREYIELFIREWLGKLRQITYLSAFRRRKLYPELDQRRDTLWRRCRR